MDDDVLSLFQTKWRRCNQAWNDVVSGVGRSDGVSDVKLGPGLFG